MMNKRLLRHGRQTQIRCAGTHRARCGDGDGHAECVQQRIANNLPHLPPPARAGDRPRWYAGDGRERLPSAGAVENDRPQ